MLLNETGAPVAGAVSPTLFDTYQGVFTLAAAMSAMRRLENMSQGIVGSDAAFTNELRLALNSAAIAAVFFDKEGGAMLGHVKAAIEQNFAQKEGVKQ